MKSQTNIRTLEGGSIDYAQYTAIGHTIRSHMAHRALGKLRRAAIKAMGSGVMPHTGNRTDTTEAAKMPIAASWHG